MTNQLIKELFEEGNKFIQQQKDPKIIVSQFNTFIQKNSQSYQLFIKSLEISGCKHVSDGFFAFHGSSEAAVRSICENGFDPTKRQAKDGDYFGINSTTSGHPSYMKGGSNHMMLVFISSKKFNTVISGCCYRVNNPTDCSYSYCLPLFIISYGVNQPVTYLPPQLPL
ncbi:hypothetical protein CL6EHI_006850 [Entamoeba histolytica]|uniref:PARP catalytic domain-containing protein n=3 Tax=Entamoeba histolytica TaxID=5759 RepID=C4M0F8_ENTH1|nr:hypothetical protein EHI_006850 [Entamoeba histolytica HM-1:IMSS]EAL49071.1 hypothetical protein EHI_006850 [Entamoeba histolytica HM-1:IMSS]EMD44411.1 zinc finger protein, putative [Entamoeba histolytica KU27]GAT94644.1 hypothetical protein CL6EHI_006850 [Entamoeba histolytica]|eukprot:XP_654461.1 hypothetical protein EHI_006850 [Entamoeba histolytica HM-1:IMSS]